MTPKLKGRAFLCAGLIALASISCTPLAPPPAPAAEASQAEDPAASAPGGTEPAGPAKAQTAAVRRGSIVESVTANGRVGGVDEVPLSLPVASRVLQVPVQQGDTVAEGQVLLETDTTAIEREITLSRERLREALAHQDKVHAAVQADQQRTKEVQERALAAQRAVAEDIQSKLRRARDELNLLRAGTPANEVLAAEGALISAQAALQRAEADRARAEAGPDSIELKAAQQEVLAATVVLRKAESDLEKLKSGADPFVVSRYESELLTAQNALEVAKRQYELVNRGPDPVELRAAERQVQSIRVDLEAARRLNVGSDRNARIAKSANVTKLELALQNAEEQVDRLKAGPDTSTVLATRRNYELAERNVRDAIERLRIARQGPDQMTIDAAEAAVDAAKLGVEKAESRVEALEAGPSPDQIEALDSVVAAAQTAVRAAEARLAEVRNPRARSMQIRDVEDRIAALQAQADEVEQAQAAEAEPADEEAQPESPELAAVEKAVSQEQIALQALEKSLSESRLVAPFAGVVSAVLARPGDPVRPGRPSIILTRGEDTIVRVDLPERDAGRVEAGQHAVVQIENVPSQFDAIVSSVVEQNGIRLGLLTVTWPSDEPVLGTKITASVQVRRKDDVLLVPQTAIRAVGSRRYVEVAEGSGTRRVDVELGMAANGDVEILNGLREGQQVVVGP